MKHIKIGIMAAVCVLLVGIAAAVMLLWNGNSRLEKTDGKETISTQNTQATAQQTQDSTVGGNENGGSVQPTTGNTEKPETSATEEQKKPSVPGNTQQTTPTVQPDTEKPFHELTWEQYDALSTQEQMAYMNQFPSIGDFAAWFNKAKEEAQKESIIVGDDPIDLGTVIGGKP